MAKPEGLPLQRPPEHFNSVLLPGFLPGNKPRPGDKEQKPPALRAGGQNCERAELCLPLPRSAPPGWGDTVRALPRPSPTKQDTIKRVTAGKGGGWLARGGWLLRAPCLPCGAARLGEHPPVPCSPCLPRTGCHCPRGVTSQEGELDPHQVPLCFPRSTACILGTERDTRPKPCPGVTSSPSTEGALSPQAHTTATESERALSLACST